MFIRHTQRNRANGVQRQAGRARRAGFTLVELLIVVVVLAIMAVIALPQFTGAAQQSRKAALDTTLYNVRSQLELYRQEHRGSYPQLDRFEQQMTLYSDPRGDTVHRRTTGFTLGPYLSELPVNPFTGGRVIANTEPGTSDWYYEQETGLFEANHDEAYTSY